MITRPLRSVLSLVAGSILATGLFAQTPAPKLVFPDPSPAATVKQRVGITDVEVNYARPGIKGRTVFGSLVPYGEIWRTGANTATKLTLSTDVKLNGTAIPAGTYELFTIPGKTEWTVIVHQNKSQWGTYSYDQKNDVARFTVSPQTLPNPVESLTIGFSDLKNDSATLYISWEKTRVPVKLEVDLVGQLVPQIEAALAAPGDKKPYFSAAMFYYDNNLDLKKATEWMNAAIAANPGQMWMIYRKGLILAKAGDKAGALAAAQESLELSKKAPGAVGIEYVRLNEALIASLK